MPPLHLAIFLQYYKAFSTTQISHGENTKCNLLPSYSRKRCPARRSFSVSLFLLAICITNCVKLPLLNAISWTVIQCLSALFQPWQSPLSMKHSTSSLNGHWVRTSASLLTKLIIIVTKKINPIPHLQPLLFKIFKSHYATHQKSLVCTLIKNLPFHLKRCKVEKVAFDSHIWRQITETLGVIAKNGKQYCFQSVAILLETLWIVRVMGKNNGFVEQCRLMYTN